jgi:hypothetical protein
VRVTATRALISRLKAIPLELMGIVGLRTRNTLPVIGLAAALILNAAWIGFLGYFVLKLL